MKVYSVVFKTHGKGYFFVSEEDININEYVIVETEKGLQYGQVISIINNNENLEQYKKIVRKATKDDEENYHKLAKEAQKALQKCKDYAKKLELNMNIISASYTFDKSQLVFSFVSDERVDFRELAKKLASQYHTRIELRQIGARDKAKEIGGVGVCGQNICCRRYLDHIDAISMNMAKNQNLALNPNKINGLCGRLLCCLQYEDENYIESSKGLPSVGQTIKTKNGEGKVTSVDVLNRKCKVLVGSNKEEIDYGTSAE